MDGAFVLMSLFMSLAAVSSIETDIGADVVTDMVSVILKSVECK